MTYQPNPGALALAESAARRATPPVEGPPTLQQAATRTWSRLSDLAARAQPGCTICGGKTGWVARIVDCGGHRGLETVPCACTGLAP